MPFVFGILCLRYGNGKTGTFSGVVSKYCQAADSFEVVYSGSVAFFFPHTIFRRFKTCNLIYVCPLCMFLHESQDHRQCLDPFAAFYFCLCGCLQLRPVCVRACVLGRVCECQCFARRSQTSDFKHLISKALLVFRHISPSTFSLSCFPTCGCDFWIGGVQMETKKCYPI